MPGTGISVPRKANVTITDDLADPILVAMLQYWEQKRGQRRMARRSDVDPLDLPRPVLPHVQLTDVVEGGRRFRYRLVGTEVVNAMGLDITGRYVDEILTGDRRAFVEEFYTTICEHKRPTFTRSKYITVRGTELIAYRILTPLSDNDSDVNIVMSAVTFRFSSRIPEGLHPADKLDLSESIIKVL
jgi:hypothetical protein